jgi:fumarate reductase flavoprotein subunit
MTNRLADIQPSPDGFSFCVETLIIGAGACGLVAALAADQDGQDVLVLERDAQPAGSTALSAGLIPAAGTKMQLAAGIDDCPTMFAADIQAKAHHENDPALVTLLATHAGATIDWLTQDFDMPFSVVTDFDYPGHSRRRMHGLPSRAGRELVDTLRTKCEERQIDIMCNATVTTLFVHDDNITGVAFTRPDGTIEQIGCGRLILACNGYGGNRAKVREFMPQIENALWFGHDGNKGEALDWAAAIGAQTHHLGAYQGHGNVAHPHGVLITWAVITQGGVQVNKLSDRFWDESQGYSEAARAVMAQPDGLAYAIFDSRIADIARQFEDFRQAEAQGAIKTADTLAELAGKLGLPTTLEATVSALPQDGTDTFGRSFSGPPLTAPYCGVQVTGALFHTQGGLVVNDQARAVKFDNQPFANLFAAGGAACGVSGSYDTGYLSGNGLLSAVVLGRIAGRGHPLTRYKETTDA